MSFHKLFAPYVLTVLFAAIADIGCGGSEPLATTSPNPDVDGQTHIEDPSSSTTNSEARFEPSEPVEEPSATPRKEHFEAVYEAFRDGPTDDDIFASAIDVHFLSSTSPEDVRQDHEQARGWHLVLDLVDRIRHGFRQECRLEGPPPDCRWHAGIDYLGEPRCDERCCNTDEPQNPGIPHLTRVCFDEQLRVNAVTISAKR